MGNDNIDSEKLLSEIDSLDDETETSSTSDNYKVNKWPVIILIIALIGLGILYFGDTYHYNFLDEVNEEYSEKQIENYMLDEVNEDYSEEQIENYIEKEELEKSKFEVQKNNIAVKNSFLNYNKELIAVILNDNDEVITDLKVEIIFYDGENKPIEIDSSNISILEKNSECYVKFADTPENFERYDFLISKEYYWYDNLEYVTEQISYEIYENEDYVDLVVKNNYSKEISEATFQVLYYDDNYNVIDVEDIYFWELKKNKTQNQEWDLSLWDNKTYDKVEYKKYEINLLGAYIY